MLASLGRTIVGPIRTLTQEDPIGLAGGLNLYGFAGGDPVNFSDPFGLKPDTVKFEGPRKAQLQKAWEDAKKALARNRRQGSERPNNASNYDKCRDGRISRYYSGRCYGNGRGGPNGRHCRERRP